MIVSHAMKTMFGCLCLSLLFAPGCGKPPPPTRVQWPVMGTVAAVQCADMRAAPSARDITQTVFERMNALLSTWRGDSELTAVNAAAGTGGGGPVSPETAIVLQSALDICDKSGGAFNPLVGPLMRAWGFNGAATRLTPPDEATLRRVAPLLDWRSVTLTPPSHQAPPVVVLPHPGMMIDLGAIAKGYALDAAWEALKEGEHTNVLIDLGGDLRALGEAAPGRGGWRTGIRNPFQPGGGCVALFLLADGEGVATSGNYERFVEIGGVRYAHIMDPRTAMPVTGMASVTVVAPTAMLADGLSTALFVLGVERGMKLLRDYPGCEAAWIPDTPLTPVIVATPGLAARLTPLGNVNFRIVSPDENLTHS